jgi:agmatinase
MAFTDQKLNGLREKYGNSHGGEIANEKFRRVADHLFSKTGTRAPH